MRPQGVLQCAAAYMHETTWGHVKEGSFSALVFCSSRCHKEQHWGARSSGSLGTG